MQYSITIEVSEAALADLGPATTTQTRRKAAKSLEDDLEAQLTGARAWLRNVILDEAWRQ